VTQLLRSKGAVDSIRCSLLARPLFRLVYGTLGRRLGIPTPLVHISPVADPENPEFLMAQREDHPPVSDSQRPQTLGGVGQRFRRRLRVIGELGLNGRPDPSSHGRIEPRNIA